MAESRAEVILEKLHRLRTELVDQAFTWERRGRPDAADAALAISGRLGELCAEFGDLRRSAE